MDKPLLSIVIANYNYGRFLEDAIRSIIAQGMGDRIELIICDAASSDDSVGIIRRYACGLPPDTLRDESPHEAPGGGESRLVSWWCSERDGGQSEAFNKGFSHARGEWLTWLNADELYMPGALKAFEACVKSNPSAQWITANMLSFDSATRRITRVNWGPHTMPPLIPARHTFAQVFGPTTFFRKELYERMGPIDERLRYGMDSEYWERLTVAGIRQTRLRFICWAFRRHEESKTGGKKTSEFATGNASERQYYNFKNGYTMRRSFRNIWYVLWVVWRIFDGSWAVRLWKKRALEGKLLDS